MWRFFSLLLAIGLNACVFIEQESKLDATQTKWLQVSVGSNHSCGIFDDGLGGNGQLYCWGANDECESGQFNLGGFCAAPTRIISSPYGPIQPDKNWRSVAVGNDHTCAITLNGDLVCFGKNYSGFETIPPKTGEYWHRIFPGENTIFAATILDKIYIVTKMSSTLNLREIPGKWPVARAPTLAFSPSDPNQISLCEKFYCFCGIDDNRRLGCAQKLPLTESDIKPTGPAGETWIDLALNYDFGCLLGANNRRVCCFGRNDVGQLGDGTTTRSDTPVFLSEPFNSVPWSSLEVGLEHSCAIQEKDNSLWCWGNNAWGQLGVGTEDAMSKKPLNVLLPQGQSGWAQISSGGNTTCATTNAGELYCWGRNNDGNLGIGALVPSGCTSTLCRSPILVKRPK